MNICASVLVRKKKWLPDHGLSRWGKYFPRKLTIHEFRRVYPIVEWTRTTTVWQCIYTDIYPGWSGTKAQLQCLAINRRWPSTSHKKNRDNELTMRNIFLQRINSIQIGKVKFGGDARYHVPFMLSRILEKLQHFRVHTFQDPNILGILVRPRVVSPSPRLRSPGQCDPCLPWITQPERYDKLNPDRGCASWGDRNGARYHIPFFLSIPNNSKSSSKL